MIVEHPIGCLQDAEYAGAYVDWLNISWQNAVKPSAVLRTEDGTEVRLQLDEETAHRGLRADDVLHFKDNIAIAVMIRPSDVLFVRPMGSRQMIRACYEAGLHQSPLFYSAASETEFLAPYDVALQESLSGLGILVERGEASLDFSRIISTVADGAGWHVRE